MRKQDNTKAPRPGKRNPNDPPVFDSSFHIIGRGFDWDYIYGVDDFLRTKGFDYSQVVSMMDRKGKVLWENPMHKK